MGKAGSWMGKPGLLDELGDIGTVCPSFQEGEDPGSRRSHLWLPHVSRERVLSAKDRFKVELEREK